MEAYNELVRIGAERFSHLSPTPEPASTAQAHKHPEQFGMMTTFDRAASAEGAQEEGCREVHCSEAALRRDDRYPIARACGRLGL